jgi:2-polyprenyl-3-methyl-5-hydroxy-6-metoxy-1,4-benzoquinol methylase
MSKSCRQRNGPVANARDAYTRLSLSLVTVFSFWPLRNYHRMNAKLNYLLTCASNHSKSERFRCPSCGSENASIVSRKYIVTSLRRCDRCELLFRAPTTTYEENEAFYQGSYRQGFTSDTPSEEALRKLMLSDFRGSERDFTLYIKILAALGGRPGDRLLDFGCSWGYGSWQLRNHGYEVVAFEISKSRCRYAREKLRLVAYDSLDDVQEGSFDIFFSAHVLEHVPSVSKVFAYAQSKLKNGGLFLAFTPNGSSGFYHTQEDSWNKLWGMVHPNFLDDRFYRKRFPDVLLASSPYDYKTIEEAWTGEKARPSLKLDGGELMAAVKIN